MSLPLCDFRITGEREPVIFLQFLHRYKNPPPLLVPHLAATWFSDYIYVFANVDVLVMFDLNSRYTKN